MYEVSELVGDAMFENLFARDFAPAEDIVLVDVGENGYVLCLIDLLEGDFILR